MSIRSYLELQADRLETLMASFKAPVRVTGGTVGPQVVKFDLLLSRATRFDSVKRHVNDIAIGLRVDSVALRIEHGTPTLTFARPKPSHVKLSTLLKQVGRLPPNTAMLGVNTDNKPLLTRLTSPDVAHVLVAGTTGSGKTVLLRSIAASLMTGNKPSALGMVVIDPKTRTFPRAFHSNHVVKLTTDPNEAGTILQQVVSLMEKRDKTRTNNPRLVVLIDELADLVMVNNGIERLLTRLVQRGREAGIHLVAATQRPSAAILSGLIRANFPLRLVGRVVSAQDALTAAGQSKTGAEKLGGQGDFIAVGTKMIRFQAAFTEKQELWEYGKTGGVQAIRLSIPSSSQGPQIEVEPVSEMDLMVKKLRPWWAKNGNQWGSKSAAVKFLFGDNTSPAGGPWDITMQVIAQIEQETSTSTAILPT